MKFIPVILIVAAVFAVCWLVDKGFTRIFRNQAEHHSGKAVRLHKNYATAGLLLSFLGIVVLITSAQDNAAMLVGAIIILITGIGLLVYYLSTGIFYDEDSFLYTSFGKKNRTYLYKDILRQQLYTVQGGHYIIELHMADGSAVMVQTQMVGGRDFLSHAHMRWCHQNSFDLRDHTYDPANYVYFPNEEET